MDDVISESEPVEQVERLKNEATELFTKEGFPMHKWHSTKSQFEKHQLEDEEQAYAREERGTKPTETKILGMNGTLAVEFRECKQLEEHSKQGMLLCIAKV